MIVVLPGFSAFEVFNDKVVKGLTFRTTGLPSGEQSGILEDLEILEVAPEQDLVIGTPKIVAALV